MIKFQDVPYMRLNMDRFEQKFRSQLEEFKHAKSFGAAYYALLGLDRIRDEFSTLAVICEARNTMDVNDVFYKEETEFFDRVKPRYEALENEMNEALLESPYQKDDRVKGKVYEISENFGAFVAVDDKYSGLIPKREFFGQARIGDVVEARVTRVKEDGKLDLSHREKTYLQIEKDAEQVLKVIDEFAGVLPFTDKAAPEVISRELSMSKNAFKKAVGHLLKEGRIEIGEKCIRKK